MPLSISIEEARRALVAYHFSPTDIPGVLERLGTVQYDPLNPLGRNPDLVFQARVPDYRVDDWQRAAYVDRIMYDAWDKMACIVPVADWPNRAYGREFHRPWHDSAVVEEHPEATQATLEELDRRGPLSSLEFEDKARLDERHGSWIGSSRVKRILRALWSRGLIVTHHREGTRHYYDRAERVIPGEHVHAPVLVRDAYYRWVIERRHQAAGMLRPKAEQAVWVACGDNETRTESISSLVQDGRLIAVHVGTKKALYHAVPQFVDVLSRSASPVDSMLFLGPLDSFLWDRRSVKSLFDFDYAWEVYKPLHLRVWGYYVLPVLFRDRLVARIDARLEGTTLDVKNWWWEQDVTPDAEVLAALTAATTRFTDYVGAKRIRLARRIPGEVRLGMKAGV